jgi:hypothetical protein
MTKAKKPTTKKTGEALRKEALADADRNIAAIEAAERGEAAVKPKSKSATKSGKAAQPHPPKGHKKMSGLDAAAKVLAESKEPMNAPDLVKTMLGKGLWKTGGATPHATIYAAMIREIANKGKSSRFRKTDRGLFTTS